MKTIDGETDEQAIERLKRTINGDLDELVVEKLFHLYEGAPAVAIDEWDDETEEITIELEAYEVGRMIP